MFCGTATISACLVNADGLFAYDDCYEFDTVIRGLESYCYSLSVSSYLTFFESGLKFNGVECISCKYGQVTCPANSSEDCSNTIMKGEGDMCDEDPIDYFAEAGTSRTAPPKTGPPSAGLDKMPPGSMSSRRSHTAKVPIVVSTAAAAWMASFDT
jgi:hypothetical protein